MICTLKKGDNSVNQCGAGTVILDIVEWEGGREGEIGEYLKRTVEQELLTLPFTPLHTYCTPSCFNDEFHFQKFFPPSNGDMIA